MCPGTEVHGLRRAGGINLDYLRVVFPRKRVDRLYAVLLEYNNDVNAAAAKLQQGNHTVVCVCVCVCVCVRPCAFKDSNMGHRFITIQKRASIHHNREPTFQPPTPSAPTPPPLSTFIPTAAEPLKEGIGRHP